MLATPAIVIVGHNSRESVSYYRLVSSKMHCLLTALQARHAQAMPSRLLIELHPALRYEPTARTAQLSVWTAIEQYLAF